MLKGVGASAAQASRTRNTNAMSSAARRKSLMGGSTIGREGFAGTRRRAPADFNPLRIQPHGLNGQRSPQRSQEQGQVVGAECPAHSKVFELRVLEYECDRVISRNALENIGQPVRVEVSLAGFPNGDRAVDVAHRLQGTHGVIATRLAGFEYQLAAGGRDTHPTLQDGDTGLSLDAFNVEAGAEVSDRPGADVDFERSGCIVHNRQQCLTVL